MSKELEAFVNDIRKAIKSIHSRPPITLKDANIVGIKLNSKSLKQLENEAHLQTSDISDLNLHEYLMGMRIYKDESADAPRYIVEGEIELDNSKPSEAMECVNYIENKLGDLRYECERMKSHKCDDLFIQEHIFTTIKQTLIKAQEQEKENTKYKKLEDQLGCSLELFIEALNKGFYFYTKIRGKDYILNSNDYTVAPFNINNQWSFHIISEDAYVSVQLKDYKKTWWLREDKSE